LLRCRQNKNRRAFHCASAADRTLLHEVIYQELFLGVIEPGSRSRHRHIMQQLVEQGA